MGSLYVSLTVDWEGENFNNILDFIEMRKNIEKTLRKKIPFTHFICPTYWTGKSMLKSNKNLEKAIDLKLDEVGLHVHCWKELITKSMIAKFETKPDWDGDGTGHGVPLGVYKKQIPKILDMAKKLVVENMKVTAPIGFRCGGWMSSTSVLLSLMQTGFAYDCSAVPPEIFSNGFGKMSVGDKKDTYGDENGVLTNLLIDLWGHTMKMGKPEVENALSLRWNAGKHITSRTQPYKIFSGQNSIVEMPNNGGLADYASEKFVTTTFKQLIQDSKKCDEPLFMNIGCHQEGDKVWKDGLWEFFNNNKAQLLSDQVDFVSVKEAMGMADLYMVD